MSKYVALGVGLVTLLLSFVTPVQAYVGPGAGLGAIGTVVALFGAVLLAVVGFIWYPIKRLLRRLRGARGKPSARQ